MQPHGAAGDITMGTAGMHTSTTTSMPLKDHPIGGHLDANFLTATMKSSDAKVIHRLEQDCFSNLLDEGERIKVIRGAIAPSVVVSRIPHLVGPEGYAEMIRMWKAACPNVTSTINIMGEHIAGDATWILTKWTKSGTFTGADLFGVSATNKPLVVHGYSCFELKGAQVVKMDCCMDLTSLAETFPVAASNLLSATSSSSGVAGGAGGIGGVVGSISSGITGMAHKVMEKVGMGGAGGAGGTNVTSSTTTSTTH